MITSRRANVLLTADINSANISKPWAEGKKRKQLIMFIFRDLLTKTPYAMTLASD